ncbi:Flp family type IVb pilin [Motilimonas cestriensis]|uniref:Flp family type IVb pilin n=1 Tax=Motilimonas cestriensis TaxID=2742685 RepID=UPI003DA6A29E
MLNKMSQLTKLKKQAGQGMTEYIIIVALIAVAAIGVYGLFGSTVRNQVASMSAELGGDGGKAATATQIATKSGQAAVDLAKDTKDANLSDYNAAGNAGIKSN